MLVGEQSGNVKRTPASKHTVGAAFDVSIYFGVLSQRLVLFVVHHVKAGNVVANAQHPPLVKVLGSNLIRFGKVLQRISIVKQFRLVDAQVSVHPEQLVVVGSRLGLAACLEKQC